MKQTNSDFTVLALTLYREARGEGPSGMQAVGCVIYNRALSENKSIYEICTAPEQFSSLTIHSDPETTLWPPVDEGSWILAQQISYNITKAMDYKDITNGALYYANVKNVTSGWFLTNIINNPQAHPISCVVGNQTFYR